MFDVKQIPPGEKAIAAETMSSFFGVASNFDIVHADGCPFLPILSERARANGWVYFIQAVNGGPIKIGTARNVKNRVAGIQGHHWQELRILGQVWGSRYLERALHRRFREYRIAREWFSDTPEIRAAAAYYAGLRLGPRGRPLKMPRAAA